MSIAYCILRWQTTKGYPGEMLLCYVFKLYFNVNYTERLCCALSKCEHCYWCESVTVIPLVHEHSASIHPLFVHSSILYCQITISWRASALIGLWSQLPVSRPATKLEGSSHDVWVWTAQYNKDVQRHIMFLNIITI